MWDSDKTSKVAKGAFIAAAGAAGTAVIAFLGSVDFGVYGPLVGALLSVAANALRQLAQPASPPAEAELPDDQPRS